MTPVEMLFCNLLINLDDLQRSTMYDESLSLHATDLNFDSCRLSRRKILSYVREKTANNPPGREHIRSEYIEDIVNGSPYILIVEINEPRSLSTGGSDWMETDIYYCTVIQSLKGDLEIGFEFRGIFFANTVFTGEQHIYATEQLEDGSILFILTSRNSLFRMDQLDEIMEIISLADGGIFPFP